MIKKIEFFFDSADGIHKLHAIKWIPETEHPVSILQVVHGMAEYIDRYDDFATYMASRNILVVMTIWDMERVWDQRTPRATFAMVMHPKFW